MSGQIHENEGEEPMVTCIECGFRSCYTHRIPWHNGLTCAEYDYRADKGSKGWLEAKRLAREEREFQEKYGEAAKPCPRCKSFISKHGGCSHMTCKSPIYKMYNRKGILLSKILRQAQTATLNSAGVVPLTGILAT